MSKTKPKAKDAAASKRRAASVYRVTGKSAKDLSQPQAKTVYAVLARSEDGLTSDQILEKLPSDFTKSANPKGAVGKMLFGLRTGGFGVKIAGLIEVVGKPKPKGKYVRKIERENRVVALLEANRKKNVKAEATPAA